ECSTAVRTAPDTAAIAFQTWDWHAALVPDALMWRYENAPGHWVKTFTEPGMLAKIGINSMGLAVCFNLLRHRGDSTTGGVPVHAIARRVLDEAATVEEARQIADSAQASASTVLTVLATGAGTPDAAAIEISPAGAATVPPGTDGWLTHTNHFLAPSLRDDGVISDLSTTVSRLQHLESIRSDGRADTAAGPGLAAFARQMCGAVGETAPICVAEDPAMAPVDRWSTMLTVLLDPAGGSIEYWPGTPYQAAQVDPAPRF
ncbi:MAG: C45 family autoproteolytic acyltransferase/hydrolase, partial [Micromonosporaceae bacterium]